MNSLELYNHLISVFERLNIDVRLETLEKGDGGLCTLNGRKILVLHEGFSQDQRVEKMIETLKGLELGHIHLPPAVRRLLGQDE